MRTESVLDALFPRIRQRLFAAMLMAADRWWYQSDLAKFLKVRPSSLQRELVALVGAGILRSRRDGNRVYFQPDPNCPILPELTGIVVKTVGLVDVLRKALRPLTKNFECAFVYGSIAEGDQRSESDVDLMVVGSVSLVKLSAALRRAETQLRRPINPSVYSRAEVEKKLASGHHFLTTVFRGPKLLIVGGSDELAKLTAKRTNKATLDEQGGDR